MTESELRTTALDPEATLRATLEAMPGLMFIFSRDGDYLDYHATDPRELFVPPVHFIGKNVRDVMPHELVAQFLVAFAESCDGKRLVEVDYALPMSGRTRYYRARISPCGADRLLAIVRDLTEQHDAASALHQAQSELARAGQLSAAAELAATVAHEVNQPLSAVLANAMAGLKELRGERVNRAELEEILRDIVRDAQRGTEIVQKIRDLFRSVPLQRSPVDVNAMIQSSLDLCAQRIRTEGVQVKLQLARDLPGVLGDVTELRQVMLNLIGNAIDAMTEIVRSARVLEIATVDGGTGENVVSVRDYGTSIPPAEIERIFDPFYTSKATGMGIGLSVCRAIIEAHHGRLLVVSIDGPGASLEIRLPSFRQLVSEDV